MASKRRRPLAAMFVAAMLSSLAPAGAAADTTPTAAQRESARSLMDAGDAAMRQRDHQAALEAYRGADAIMHVPTTGLAVARAHVALGHLVEASDALARVRRIPKSADESEPFRRARREAERLFASLPERIPGVTVQIVGPADDAAVTFKVDGAPYRGAVRGQPLRVNPGQHRIEAAADGYRSGSGTVTLREGELRELKLELEPAPRDAAPAASAKAPVDDPTTEISPASYAALSLGGVSLVVGAITGAVSLSMTSDLESDCVQGVCPADRQDDHDTILALANTSNVTLALGGVGVGLGVVLLVLDLQAETPSKEGVSIRPMLGAGSIGVEGTF